MAGAIHSLLEGFRKTRLAWLKLQGKMPEDVAEKHIVSGKAWEEYCERLKAAGAALLYPGAPLDGPQQVEGVRYLTRLTRASLEAFVEYNDPYFPELRRMVHETVKMGADNPDNHYLNAQIDGNVEYVIEGERNTIHYLGFFTQNGNYGSTGGLTPCGVLEGDDIVVRDDGTFTIHLSHKPKGENWLKTEPDTGLIMVRQTYMHRDTEEPATMTIRAIGGPDSPLPLTAEQLESRLKTAALFVAGAPMLFSRWAKGYQKHTNQLPLFDPEVSNNAGGDANILYYHSHWKLADDEALVINTPVPECDMWNFQLNNYWMESLDYRFFRICINKGSAVTEPDGSVKVIVSHRDPDHPNWIQTAGHNEGTMCWRWYRPAGLKGPEPSTQVVKFDKLVT